MWMTPFERDHRIAESLQRVLLRSPPKEALPRISVEFFYEPASDEANVCGDYFDAFAIDEQNVVLVVGDASGRGLAAAERIAETKFALRTFFWEHRDPRQALSRLNEFAFDFQPLGRRDGNFVTVALTVLNCASGDMECLSAGGEPPLVLRENGVAKTTEAGGPAIGVFRGYLYQSTALRLEAGDLLLMATDGITEARQRHPQHPAPDSDVCMFLGMEGMAQLASEAHGSSPGLRQIGQSVFEGARAFGHGSFQDDACLLICRREAG